MKSMFKHKIAKATTAMGISWQWYDESQGLIQWTFSNPTDQQQSVVLERNGYYFGNAFWPVYEANPGFATSFASAVTPLVDNGVTDNSPPLFVGEVDGRYGIYFLFTLSPGQTWSMLEGGFSGTELPIGISLHSVTSLALKAMSIGYAEAQVTDWNQQSNESLSGYSPNPETFTALVGQIDGTYITLFNDPISAGTSAGSSSYVGIEFKKILGDIERAIALMDYTGLLDSIDHLVDEIRTWISRTRQGR